MPLWQRDVTQFTHYALILNLRHFSKWFNIQHYDRETPLEAQEGKKASRNKYSGQAVSKNRRRKWKEWQKNKGGSSLSAIKQPAIYPPPEPLLSQLVGPHGTCRKGVIQGLGHSFMQLHFSVHVVDAGQQLVEAMPQHCSAACRLCGLAGEAVGVVTPSGI